MIVRSSKVWMVIALGMVVLACIVLTVLTMLAHETPLARVRVPGSNLTLVLYSDEKGLYRYEVTAGGKTVGAETLLGARGALTADPQISVLGDQVTITFRTSEHGAPFVEFDLAQCKIVAHSNGSSPPPPITNCQRR